MSSEAAMSWEEANEAAGAALHGLKQRRPGNVSEEEHQLLLQKYDSTVCELVRACEERDKARKLFLECQSVSKAVFVKLEKKCERLQADLRACQKELRKYEQACQQQAAEIKQIHLRYGVQLVALKVEGEGMQRTILELQQQVSEKEHQVAAREQEVRCCKQELAAVKAENQELKQVNLEVQQMVAQAQDNMGVLMKMLSATQQTNSNSSNKVSLSVGTTTDDDLTQFTDNSTQQQAQVTVVLNISDSSIEENNLKALNTRLQEELVLHKQLLCLHEQQLKAVRGQKQKLQEQNKQLEQLLFELDERVVELEQLKPEVSLVLNVGDVDDRTAVAQEQSVIIVVLSINAVDEIKTKEVRDLKDQLAANVCQHQQDMAAIQVSKQQLQERVDALQYLVAEKDDKIQELEQKPQVMMVVEVANHDNAVQAQVTELKQQVSVLKQNIMYLEAELRNRINDTLLNQQQMAAALAPTPATVPSSTVHPTGALLAAPEHLSPVLVKHSSSSKSSSLLSFKRRFTADSSSSSQPGTPATPALSHSNSFAVGRSSNSSSNHSSYEVEGRADGCAVEINSCLAPTADGADGVDTASDRADGTEILIKPGQLKQPRHKTLFRRFTRRFTRPFVCLMSNSSSMVKEL